MELKFGKRRAVVFNVKDEMAQCAATDEEIKNYEFYDLIYRSLCAVLFNYVPTSGHPGGSISSGRFVERALYDTMAYDFSNPNAEDADIISYAAGHKALGLYAMWALRNEVVRIGQPDLLPKNINCQLRLEDLLGFRRNPTTDTPLFKEHKAKPLDGHPTPATPFVKLSTGASGVGCCASFGLALGAIDYYGADNAPRVHVVEGEGGMTPGRVQEGFAFAATSGLKNLVTHIDWNQASIDSNHVTRDESGPGDYVQWDPIEFSYMNDWNVIIVPDGKDFHQVFAAQKLLNKIENNQPTAIVYKTVKGWKYGIEGRASHGAGHKFCSDGYYAALKEAEDMTGIKFPRFDGNTAEDNVEKYYFDTLLTIRKKLEENKEVSNFFATKVANSKERLNKLARKPRGGSPNLEAVFNKKFSPGTIPAELQLKVGDSATLRGALGDVLAYYNKLSGGSLMVAAADLLGSTSISTISKDFPEGFYHAVNNAGARTLSVGGICEDAIGGVASGLSAYGKHIGAGSSYAAFIAALQHITMRLHGIGQQSKVHAFGGNYNPFIAICAHTGLKTGEDGPTHADPQALQIIQENFPSDVMVTLTPWDPQEIWPLMTAALQSRPCVIAPFVTRPNEKVLDRSSLGMPPASAAAKGVYAMRKAKTGKGDGTLVLQESGVTYAFVEDVLAKLDKDGLDLNIYYVSSAELFDALPEDEQLKIFPEELRREAMGITGFTLATIYRFVTSERGRRATLHPFKKGHYMGSGQAHKVLEEAGLDSAGQYKAIKKYLS